MFLFSNDKIETENLKRSLSNKFSIKDLGEVKQCLGMNVTFNKEKGYVTLSQETHIEQLLTKFQLSDCKTVDTPMEDRLKKAMQKQKAIVDADWASDSVDRRSYTGFSKEEVEDTPKVNKKDEFDTNSVEDDIVVEDEDNEFEHFQDPEEFEGFQESTPRNAEQPKITISKRQDLVNVLLGVVRPNPDTLLIRVELGKDDNDPFVLCVAQKKVATRLSKEMQDLSMFCPERRPGDKHGLPGSLSVMSECAEATAALLDARVVAALTQYAAHVQYIHVSDRYCGPKQMESVYNIDDANTLAVNVQL
nr:uncharacterized protein LOC116771412 [Danaus plexippus plexippus]